MSEHRHGHRDEEEEVDDKHKHTSKKHVHVTKPKHPPPRQHKRRQVATPHRVIHVSSDHEHPHPHHHHAQQKKKPFHFDFVAILKKSFEPPWRYLWVLAVIIVCIIIAFHYFCSFITSGILSVVGDLFCPGSGSETAGITTLGQDAIATGSTLATTLTQSVGNFELNTVTGGSYSNPALAQALGTATVIGAYAFL
jgi:hypothetical protein